MAGTMDVLSLPPIILSMTAYFLAEQCARQVFQRINPKYYEKLVADRKDVRSFVFLAGVFITVLISTPSCLVALVEKENTSQTGAQIMTTSGQICVASRAVLWMSELNRLDYARGYIVHHVGSLSQLAIQLKLGLPMKPIYAIYASLFTETFSSSGCLLAANGLTAKNSPIARRLQVTNALLLPILRLPPIVYGYYTVKDSPWNTFLISAAMLAIYGRFIINMAISESKRLHIAVADGHGNLVMFERFRIPIFGLFVTVSYWSTLAVATTIYGWMSTEDPSVDERRRISALLSQVVISAYVGARIPSLVRGSGLRALFSRQLFSRTGFWIQGGMVAGAAATIVSPFSSLGLHARGNVLASLAVALPLGEAIGRIGCHFAGCCGANKLLTKQKLSAPILASILLLVGFSVTLAVLITKTMDLYASAFMAILLQALVRLLFDTLRDDVPRSIHVAGWKVSPTTLAALGQAIFSLAALCMIINLTRSATTTLPQLRVPSSLLSRIGLVQTDNKLSEILRVSVSGFAWLASLPLAMLQSCSGGEERVEPLSSFPHALAPLFSPPFSPPLSLTEACAINGGYSLDKPLLTSIVGPVASLLLSIPLGLAKACSSAEESMIPILSLPLGLTQACAASEEGLDTSMLTATVAYLLPLFTSPFGFLQACSSAEGAVEKPVVLSFAGLLLSILSLPFAFTRACGSGSEAQVLSTLGGSSIPLLSIPVAFTKACGSSEDAIESFTSNTPPRL